MNDLKKKEFKIFDIFREWTESMTMHGFPNIFRTKYVMIRIMWIALFLVSNSFCFYIIATNIMNYFKYDVVTTIKVVEKDSLPFPAVTVCNSNAFLTEEGLKYAELFLNENNFTNFPDVNLDGIFKGNFSRLYFSYNFIKYLASLLSKVNQQEYLKKLSLLFEKKFISCLYNLQPCNQNDWEWYYDYYYGSCYRFNTGRNSKGEKIEIKQTNKDGKYYGLMIELFVGIPDNQKTLSFTRGAHIFVDENHFNPVTQRGYDVAPGFSTNLAIERIVTKLMPKPYSECVENLDTIDSFDSELYRKVISSNLTYRQLDCFDAYLSSEINKKCKCEQISNNLIIEKNNACDTFEEQFCASVLFREKLETNYKSKIKLLCPLECESVKYRVTKSENKYPSESYGKDLLKMDKIKSLFDNRSNVSNDELSNNILAVNVYYEYSEQTEIIQSASISWDALVGSVGGTLGLFLGISFLSFAEFIDLFFQILFRKLATKNTINFK